MRIGKGEFDFSDDDLSKHYEKSETLERIFGEFTDFVDPKAIVILNSALRPVINKVLASLPETLQQNFPDNIKQLLENVGEKVLPDDLAEFPAEISSEGRKSFSDDLIKRYDAIYKRQKSEFAITSSLDIESMIIVKDGNGKEIFVFDDSSYKELTRYDLFQVYQKIISLCIGTHISMKGTLEIAWKIKIWLPEIEIEDLSSGASKSLWTFKIESTDNLDFLAGFISRNFNLVK